MTDTTTQPDEACITPYDDVVDAYNLAILKEVGDWSLDDTGDLVLTKDGDIKVGDTAYNGLFRLVQTWRFSEVHLRYLFATMNKMLAWHESLGDRMNAIGVDRHARMMGGHFGPDDTFAEAFHDVCDQQATAIFGAGIYGGSLMLMLSGALLRLRDDIDGKMNWTKVGPLFNGYSVGEIVEAGANGFRHAHEWANSPVPTARQKPSREIITGALLGRPVSDESGPGRCVELLHLLSRGDFEGLATNIFAFAHSLALNARKGEGRAS